MEIRSLLDAGELEQAYEMAENLDIDRVASIVDLKVIASVYERMGNYEDAMEVLYRSYEKKPTKMVVYRLAYLCVKTKKFDDAEFFYQEFTAMAPNSPDKYILRYGIDRAKGVDYYVRIATLQQLKAVDYREEWGYELAKVYHKAGLYDDCIRECDDLILWFGEGVIVEKAKLLKKYHLEGKSSLDAYGVFEKNLTPEQVEYNREKFRFDTQDLGRQVRELAETEMEHQLRGDLERDLEKTVDLRKAMIEDTEALDLLGREVHRSWGSTAPAQGSEVIQIKKLRTKNEQRSFWKNKKNIPDMEEILAEEESDMDVEPAEEDWEIKESVATQPKFQAAKLQEELAKEIARFDEEEDESIDDYMNISMYEEKSIEDLLQNEEPDYEPEQEETSEYEEIVYKEEPDHEPEQEGKSDYEEIAYKEEPDYEPEQEEKPEYEEIVYKEEPDYEPEQEETDYEEIENEEQEEKSDYEEVVDEEEKESAYEEILHKEKQERESNYKETQDYEKIENEEIEEAEVEIPTYVHRDKINVKQENLQETKENSENMTGEQKTMNIFRKLLGKREKNKEEKKQFDIEKIDGKIEKADKIEPEKDNDENAKSEQNHDRLEQEVARVRVVKVTPATMKNNKKQQKGQILSSKENKKKVTTGVVKRYMGKKTQSTFTDQETNVVYDENVQEAETKVIDSPEEEKQESCVSMEDVYNLFPQYQQNLLVCEGILSFLQSVFDETGARNLIVTSKNQDNAIVLCANMADVLCDYGVIENKQPVTIAAEELNKMHLEQNYEQIAGRILHITGARKITPDTAQSIMNMVKELGNNVIIVLNDGKPYMDDFMNEYKIMQKYFPHWIIF